MMLNKVLEEVETRLAYLRLGDRPEAHGEGHGTPEYWVASLVETLGKVAANMLRGDFIKRRAYLIELAATVVWAVKDLDEEGGERVWPVSVGKKVVSDCVLRALVEGAFKSGLSEGRSVSGDPVETWLGSSTKSNLDRLLAVERKL